MKALSIKQIMNSSLSEYTGSETTKSIVEDAIREKYGEAELRNLDCYHNTRTFHSWAKLGFKIRRGEKAIKSITFVEQKDANGNILRKYRRPVFLFYYRQVEKISQTE